jgi:hypothetical protein
VLLTYFFNSINKKHVFLTCLKDKCHFYVGYIKFSINRFVGNFCPTQMGISDIFFVHAPFFFFFCQTLIYIYIYIIDSVTYHHFIDANVAH